MKARVFALWRTCFAFDTLGQTLRSLGFGVLLLAVLALPAFWAYGRTAIYLYKPHNMITLSGKNQTQCVGRYLIDTPIELGRFNIHSSEFIYGLDANFKSVEVKVAFDDQTPAQFVAKTHERSNELKTKLNDELKTPLLLTQEVWETPHGKALMLRYLKNALYSFSQVNSELHILVANRHVTVVGTSSEAEDKNVKEGRESYKFIDPKPMEERLKVIAQNIKGYTEASKAPEGFCMAGVVMNNKTMGYDVETTLFNMWMDDKLSNSDLTINMEGQFQQYKESLIERMDRVNPQIRLMAAAEGVSLQTVELRKGLRSINGMPGLEYAEGEHEAKGVSFRMQAETRLTKTQQSLQRPAFSLDLKFGDFDGPSPLDQSQALQIWDILLNSMRLSPANGGQSIDPQSGAVVPTTKVGQTCPASGVWKASLPSAHPASRKLASAASRYANVLAGQAMPEVYAKFMFPQTADADNAAVTWTLVHRA